MSELKNGDRVIVNVPPRRAYSGTIVGEGRGGIWWIILKDGNKRPQAIHKSFCRREQAEIKVRA